MRHGDMEFTVTHNEERKQVDLNFIHYTADEDFLVSYSIDDLEFSNLERFLTKRLKDEAAVEKLYGKTKEDPRE